MDLKEAKKEQGSDSEGKKKGRKAYVPDELSFTPEINQRSKNIKRGKDVTTVLLNDAEFRSARREKAAQQKNAKEAQESKMNMVKPCSKDSKNHRF